jgi:hypothetical protein
MSEITCDILFLIKKPSASISFLNSLFKIIRSGISLIAAV